MKRFFFGAASVLALSALGCAASTGESQSAESEEALTTPLFEYGTSGGFTRFDLDVKVFPSGSVIVTEKLHGGASVQMFNRLSATELAAVKQAIPANFASLPSKIFRSHFLADIPTITLSSHGKSVALVPMAGAPVADQQFLDFAGALSNVFSIVSDKELLSFESSGGFAPRNVKLTVKNSGECHLTETGVRTLDTACFVDSALLGELHAQLEAKNTHGWAWYQLPASYSSSAVDGINYKITYDGAKGAKAVASGTGANEAAELTAVHDVVSKIVASIESLPR